MHHIAITLKYHITLTHINTYYCQIKHLNELNITKWQKNVIKLVKMRFFSYHSNGLSNKNPHNFFPWMNKHKMEVSCYVLGYSQLTRKFFYKALNMIKNSNFQNGNFPPFFSVIIDQSDFSFQKLFLFFKIHIMVNFIKQT